MFIIFSFEKFPLLMNDIFHGGEICVDIYISLGRSVNREKKYNMSDSELLLTRQRVIKMNGINIIR